jgi:hypothetical protein
VLTQPFASFAETVYVPAPSPENVPDDWYDPEFNLYKIVPTPPFAAARILPSVPPQFAFVEDKVVKLIAGGS